MNDRIKLAEAMGWPCKENCTDEYIFMGCKAHDEEAFDPFTDANDDYAVLEWMRYSSAETWLAVTEDMARCQGTYMVGDYARAALKVIG